MTPTLLIPGLLCTPRLYAEQIPALWRFGPVMVADHTRHDNVQAIAEHILADAPPRFALAGLSMGGSIALEIMRLAPERVQRLALLDSAAIAETPEQTERRRAQCALAREGRLDEVVEQLFALFFHRVDASHRAIVDRMAEETGAETFVRQQHAIVGRPDSRPRLGAIGCPTLVLVGEHDELTPPELSEEIAGAVPGARLVVLEDCGHLSTVERPREVTRALVEWLA